MIVYNLRCANSHEFEGWFKDSAAFDAQAGAAKLVCPVCGLRKVEKAIMGAGRRGHEEGRSQRARRDAQDAPVHDGLAQICAGQRRICRPAFCRGSAQESITAKPRSARSTGESTVKEAVELVEEGIDVAALPPDLDETAN